MWNILPNEIINIIFQYDGRIKYRRGKYMNQLIIEDNKFQLIKKHLIEKYYIFHLVLDSNGDTFYMDFTPDNNFIFGIIHDYNYHGNGYTISFYKDIRNTFWYKIKNIFYKLFNKHQKFLFISNYKYL